MSNKLNLLFVLFLVGDLELLPGTLRVKCFSWPARVLSVLSKAELQGHVQSDEKVEGTI